MKFFTFITSTICLIVCFSSSAFAEDSTEARAVVSTEILKRSTDLSSSIMSPFCPGRTLSACPSDQARAVRDEIIELIAQGNDESQVVSILQGKYGDEITGTPKFEGFGKDARFVYGRPEKRKIKEIRPSPHSYNTTIEWKGKGSPKNSRGWEAAISKGFETFSIYK